MSVTFSSYSITVPGKGVSIQGQSSGRMGRRTFFTYQSAIQWLQGFLDQNYGSVWECKLSIALDNGTRKTINNLERGWPGDFDAFCEYLMNYFDRNPDYV